MGQGLFSMGRGFVGMAVVAVLDRRLEMRGRLGDMRILIAGVLSLRID